MKMKLIPSVCAALVTASVTSNAATIIDVTADTNLIAQAIGGAALSDRSGSGGDWILGANGGGERIFGMTFDPSTYATLAQDADTTLLSASLVLRERAARDANNGTQTGTLTAFFSVGDNAGFSVGMANAGNQGATAGSTGFFGNSAFRAGPFGGGAGPDNEALPGASTAFTYVVGTTETFTIDLLSNTTAADVQALLATHDTANGGIFVRSTAGDQTFFTSDFDLVLQFSQVPEPSSTALLGLGALGFILRRRR